MYCNENADLSDGEDGEHLPLDTEVKEEKICMFFGTVS